MVNRVVLAPIGSTGDVMPLALIGVALREVGWDVSACATRDFRSLFEQRGIRFQAIDVDARDLSAGLDGGIAAVLRGARRLRPVAQIALDALDEAFRDVDLVVGSALQLFAPAFCSARGIPYVYASSAPTNERGAQLPPHFVPIHGAGRVGNAALWAAQNAVFDRLFRAIATDAYERAGRARPPKRLLETISSTPLVLGLYDRAIVGPEHRGAAPLGACFIEDDVVPLDADFEAFLAAGPPPVYITFGSMTARDPHARTALVLDAVEKAGVRAVLDKGWGGMAERMGHAERVHWVSGVNYHRLLPRLAAIVHHGGAGTIAMSARAGLPQVIVPHITDQFYFGRRIAALHAGPKPLPVKRLSGARLAKRIVRAVNDPAIRAGAGALAGQIGGADGPQAAARALTAYVSR